MVGGGEGDDQLWGSGRGAIARCHSSVLWLGGRVTTNFNFGGMDVVPLLGAIAGCHCSVLWWGGSVTTNFGGVDVVPLQGVIVVCYGGGREGFGGVDVVPLQGANFCFISSSYIQGHQFHADAQENNNEFSFLQTLHCLFSTLITQKLVFAIWGLRWYNFFRLLKD